MSELATDPRLDALVKAAKAVVDRWDSPDWKEPLHTGDLIHRLRKAVEEFEAA